MQPILLKIIVSLIGDELLANAYLKEIVACVLSDNDQSYSRFKTLVGDWLPDDIAVQRLWDLLYDIFFEDVTEQVMGSSEKEAFGLEISQDRAAHL